MGRENGPSPEGMGLKKQYSPGEIADMEISRAQSDAATERQRERLRKAWDADTSKRVVEIREEKGEDAANSFQQRRDAYRDEGVEESIHRWARQEMEVDLRKQEADMERHKPENEAEALRAIDRLWDDINKALNYRPEREDLGESIIDKNWGHAVLMMLNDLRDQIRFEKSFPTRMFKELNKAYQGNWSEQYSWVQIPLGATEGEKRDLRYRAAEEGRQKKWLEGNWTRKIDSLIKGLSTGGEEYTETPADERKRRADRDRAVSAYKAGEIRKQVA